MLALNGGWGVTESVGASTGAHHRGQAGLGLAFAPFEWLSFGLQLDGRLELHPDDGAGAHAAAFGDPRLITRVGRALGDQLALGLELRAWFPGTDAPSIVASATSLDVRLLGSLTPSSGWTLLALAGYRLDNSAQSAPDLRRLRIGDRISLGVSASDALLFALGLARELAPRAELFGELSADLLLGTHSPALTRSPLRAAAGGRYLLSDAWQAELCAVVSLSQRPALGPNDGLVPIEPRLTLLLGLRWAIDLTRAAPRAGPAATPVRAPELPAPAAPPALAAVSGKLLDERGAPLPDVQISLRRPDGSALETISDAEGGFAFAQVSVGPAALELSATGYRSESWPIEVRVEQPALPPRALTPALEAGLLRGLIRSWQSEPLAAQILVRDRRGKSVAERQAGADGRFELSLPPGSYEVTVSAPGYRALTRRAKVEGNGVAILNLDLREAR